MSEDAEQTEREAEQAEEAEGAATAEAAETLTAKVAATLETAVVPVVTVVTAMVVILGRGLSQAGERDDGGSGDRRGSHGAAYELAHCVSPVWQEIGHSMNTAYRRKPRRHGEQPLQRPRELLQSR
ncbi:MULTISPECIES: hypothetical protein [Streptomyces]|uniref:hypothetical protein n=1 Tax=Streptomyces TaxID=1883 RepID=UPI0034437321